MEATVRYSNLVSIAVIRLLSVDAQAAPLRALRLAFFVGGGCLKVVKGGEFL